MTTRHTITHADEIYAGNAFLQGTDSADNTVGSPDGRRGIQKKHSYYREYGAVVATDEDGIVSSNALASSASTIGLNFLTTGMASGALVTTEDGGTVIFDVPRNIVWKSCGDDSTNFINIIGKDEYGQIMVEKIKGSNDSIASGVKAFKSINSITITAVLASVVSIGTGDHLGLPYHLTNKGRFLGYYVDGMHPSGGATEVVLTTGLDLATTGTSSNADPDVRGTFLPIISPNATLQFTAVMLVDPSTRNKAYGVPQATVIT